MYRKRLRSLSDRRNMEANPKLVKPSDKIVEISKEILIREFESALARTRNRKCLRALVGYSLNRKSMPILFSSLIFLFSYLPFILFLFLFRFFFLAFPSHVSSLGIVRSSEQPLNFLWTIPIHEHVFDLFSKTFHFLYLLLLYHFV